MFSNRYIFIYASVMVIVVAAVLSTAANLLKPLQERNKRVEKIQNILASANIYSEKNAAEEIYNKHITAEFLVSPEGELLSEFRNGSFKQESKLRKRAFDAVLKEELGKLEKFNTGEEEAMPAFPIYECMKGDSLIYIIPVMGKGLWGPIWGNIALAADLNTIVGANFDHKSETPGLGAEIADTPFENMFKGDMIFDENGDFVSVTVVKGGVASSPIPEVHGVDAISGGTITSNGVTDMLNDCLSIYVPYIKKLKE